MSKLQWKGSTLLAPVPAALVSCGTLEKPNALTIAWTGITCSDPPMTYISVRPERYSYDIIKESGEFVINLTSGAMARATDFCGVRSGREMDKLAATGLTVEPAKEIAALMEHLGVYWTVAFGNHDTEAYSYYSREQISDFYGNSGFKYCLFQKGPDDVDGYGNQVINVKNSKGILTQSLYIFDSHSYTDGDFLGMMWKYDNIHENQVQWYRDNVNLMNKQNNERLKELGLPENSDVKSLAFFHIPLTEQRDAWYEYMANGFKDTENVKYVYGKAGEGKKIIYCGMGEDDLFETIQELGSTKGLFFGHDHDNNFSIYYKGIRMTYGYSIDYLAYSGINKRGSQRGCTIITVSPDGTFDCKAENYYQKKYQSQYEKEQVTMQDVTEASTHL